jgi:hypothetical protein
MLESIVELPVGLFLIALTLLIGSCIVGSVVAALRSVSHGSARVNNRAFKPEIRECAFVSEYRPQLPDRPSLGLHLKTF